MNVKRYIADTASEAMEKVRQELGRDAVILNTRTIRRKGFWGFLQKPLVEVVAAYEKKEARPPFPPISTVSNGRGYGPPVTDREPSPSQLRWETPEREPEPAKEPEPAREKEAAPAKEDDSDFEPYTPAEIYKALVAAERKISPQSRDPLGLTPVEPKVVPTAPHKPAGMSDEKLGKLESQISQMNAALGQVLDRLTGEEKPAENPLSPAIQELTARLTAQGTEACVAHELGIRAQELLSSHEYTPLTAMEQVLRETFGRPEPILTEGRGRQVVMLVGATGVGKTTTLAKLAAIHAVRQGERVGLITADTYRVAAVEQLRAYADILELPVSVVYDASEIGQALSEQDSKDVVFVDTAGISPSDSRREQELRALISHTHPDMIYLVVSAATSFPGLRRIFERYGSMGELRLIVTKLDEVDSLGVLLNICAAGGRSISYIAAGQNVPEDIRVTDVDRLVEVMLGGDGK